MVLAADLGEISLRLLVAALLAPATTVISLRLLGTRRGWGAGFVSGVVGWGGGAILALWLSGWDLGADSLLIHITAIAIPATMGVAAAFDLLARPGALAAVEQAGLIITPRPIRALRQRIDVVRRYPELLDVARWLQNRTPPEPRERIQPILELELGGSASDTRPPSIPALRRTDEPSWIGKR